jgi:hypothetical protein
MYGIGIDFISAVDIDHRYPMTLPELPSLRHIAAPWQKFVTAARVLASMPACSSPSCVEQSKEVRLDAACGDAVRAIPYLNYFTHDQIYPDFAPEYKAVVLAGLTRIARIIAYGMRRDT